MTDTRGGRSAVDNDASGRARRAATAGRPRRWVVWLAVAVAVVLTVSGYAGYRLWIAPPAWERDAAKIPGITIVRDRPAVVEPRHVTGRLNYPEHPPIGGDHNPVWQQCNGNIYAEPVADEHAVHSMEHGAIWIAYRPGLPAADLAALESRVRGRQYLFLSPYPGLDHAVSLQAWGYQLRVDTVDDPRVDRFIALLRENAAHERYAPCGEGTTVQGAAANP